MTSLNELLKPIKPEYGTQAASEPPAEIQPANTQPDFIDPGERERKIAELRAMLFTAVQAEPTFKDKGEYQFADRESFDEAIRFTERCWQKVAGLIEQIAEKDYFIFGSFAADSLNRLDAIGRPHNDLDVVVPTERLKEIQEILSGLDGIEGLELDEIGQTVHARLFLSSRRDEPNFSIDIMGATKEKDHYLVRGVFPISAAEFVQQPRTLLGQSARFASKECVTAAKKMILGGKSRLIDAADLKAIGIT